MNSDNSLAEYIEGIAKASFCKPKCEQQYVSLAHFLSIQPRECMKVRDEYYPDMIVGSIKDIFGKSDDTRIAYIWLPTPPKKSSDQHKYVDACRKRMVEVLAKSQFDEIWLDVRGNIGGVLSTVIDAIYPILAKRLGEGVYLYGVDNKGKRVTTFEFHTQAGVSRHIIRPSDAYIPSGMAPVEHELADIFKNKATEKTDILKNLNPAFSAREYQKEALGRFYYYCEEYHQKLKPIHLMFNMAPT
jgi:hypothetical protein